MIERDPFRIAVYGAGNRPVLQQVANDDPEPLETQKTVDPVGPGIENPETPRSARHSVSSWAPRRWSSTPPDPFQANLLQGEHSGIQYAGRAVIEANPVDRGVRLRLSTNDPSGRELVVGSRLFALERAA